MVAAVKGLQNVSMPCWHLFRRPSRAVQCLRNPGVCTWHKQNEAGSALPKMPPYLEAIAKDVKVPSKAEDSARFPAAVF